MPFVTPISLASRLRTALLWPLPLGLPRSQIRAQRFAAYASLPLSLARLPRLIDFTPPLHAVRLCSSRSLSRLPLFSARAHSLPRIPAIDSSTLTRLNHLLQTPIRVDLHRVQVVKPVHPRRFLAEFLGERVG